MALTIGRMRLENTAVPVVVVGFLAAVVTALAQASLP